MSKESDALLKSLEANLPPDTALPMLSAEESAPKEIQDDYEFSRETQRTLVANGQRAIEAMMEMALNSDNPRAFEVLSTMLKDTSEIADKLMELQKKKKEVTRSSSLGNGSRLPGQQNIFIGSTAELQKQLKQVFEYDPEKNDEVVIEADAARPV